MIDGCKSIKYSGACVLHALFVILAWACASQREDREISLVWKDNRATGLFIPESVLLEAAGDTVTQGMEVRLVGPGQPPVMLGEFVKTNGGVVFQPVVPFTRGLRYEIRANNHTLKQIDIPSPPGKAEIMAIYPSADTVPENLLKIYLHFSMPMQSGVALQNIAMLDEKGDTLQGVFLDLQPELWNHENTILTLWLDPGRIKRDLKPNLALGPPVTRGRSYSLAVSRSWSSAAGSSLSDNSSIQWHVVAPDSVSPSVSRWTIISPPAGSNRELVVQTGESLDHELLNATVRVVTDRGEEIAGRYRTGPRERTLLFQPTADWKIGHYKLEIETRLEDLAGNNLNRVFDRDVKNSSAPGEASTVAREFEIRP